MEYTSPDSLSLLDALALLFPDSSKTTLRFWIKSGRISKQGIVLKRGDFGLNKGDVISIGPRQTFVSSKFPIIYCDEDIVVIDKPAGLLSVSTAFESKETVFAHLKLKFPHKQVYVVHRLDQDTSGTMVFALSESSFKHLKKKFAAHDIKRCYTAIVEGELQGKGTWDSYLYEDANYVVRLARNPSEGEHAITHYNAIKSKHNHTWLELTLETGKKNQIRVQSLHAGHPIAGDKKYGAEDSPIKRLCLHAHLLQFEHPSNEKLMTFTSPIPRDFYRILDPRTK